MPTTPRRWMLRERTSAAHSAVDAAIGAFGDLTGYTAYLQSIAAFRQPLERQWAAFACPPGLAGGRPTAVGAAISADLVDLGVPPSSRPAGDLALRGDGLFGALYVLEGSALGARLLFERAKTLGLSSEFGARHLALLSRSIEGWRGFLDRLEAAEPFDIDQAVETSVAVFARARAAFEGSLHG